MSNRTLWITLALSVFSASAQAATTPAAVDKALSNAKAYLYKQEKDGTWEEGPPSPKKGEPAEGQNVSSGQYTGRTALAVLAMLYAGESSSDPRIKSAVDFLQATPAIGVYALGLRCQVWLLLPQSPATKAAMLRDAKVLQASMKVDGEARGMYDYIASPSKTYSHSRSQYAVLGMWAAQQSGVEVPDQYWQIVEEGWKRDQASNGGWGYSSPAKISAEVPVTPGMTTVGIASLLITQEYLRADEGVVCKGNQVSAPIARGLKWLGDNMDKFATDKKYPRDFPYPTLYAYERVGAASGLRYFGGIDWYEKGAEWALSKQSASGGWSGNAGGNFSPMVDTCFAMLFLAKGRAPLVISKLQYSDAAGKEGNWNQRSRDVANVTRWIGKTIEHELAFQVVDTKASLADMLESPLLYLSGNNPVQFSDADQAKIKAYIEGGGILLANADCGGIGFTTSIKKLGKAMFPDSEFSELPQDDLIYTNYYPRSKWKSKPSVLSLSNGARQQIILIPQADPAKAWQLEDSRSRNDMFELPADILLYAVDRQGLRYRGERFYLPDDSAAKATKTVTVTRLKYPGFWDPEPGGWRRLNNYLLKRQSLGVTTTVAELGKGELGTAKIAHLTGTFDYKFSDAQKDELKKFIDAGGTLIVDAAGGNSKFATAAETLLTSMYPDNKLETLPPDHALFSAGGAKAEEITYRTFAIRNGVGHTDAPRLQGITLNNRLAIIYSREDLSVGLVGQAVDGIIGYSPVTATNLMTRIISFAAGVTAGPPQAETREKTDKPKTPKAPTTEPAKATSPKKKVKS